MAKNMEKITKGSVNFLLNVLINQEKKQKNLKSMLVNCDFLFWVKIIKTTKYRDNARETTLLFLCVSVILSLDLFWYFVLGILVFNNGDRYEGEFKNGKKHD